MFKEFVAGITASLLVTIAVPAIANHGLPHGSGGGSGTNTKNVDCDVGDTIQAALDKASEGDTINVTGPCPENLVIKVDHVTIDGGGSATIDGSGDPSSPTVLVLGTDVTIKGLTITGGWFGIHITQNGGARVNNSTIMNTGRHGISLDFSSAALIENCTISNTFTGIDVNKGSSAHIIGCLITNNRNHGIAVLRTSYALIEDSTITGNDDDGISLRNSSRSDINNNIITGNLESGIQVHSLSGIHLSDNGVPNFIQNNSDYGVLCTSISTVRVEAVQNFGTGNGIDNARISGSCLLDNQAGDPEIP